MSEKRIEIQWLRGLAALEVVVVHSDLVTKHISSQTVLTGAYHLLGGIGVEVFFIVSGFIMCARVPFSRSWLHFLVNRVRRIFPMYWIMTTVAVLIFLMQPSWVLVGRNFTLEWILSSYLILPQHRFPPLGPGWTLEHEMVFYVLVTLALAVLSARLQARFVFGALVAAIGVSGCYLGPALDQPAWISHLFSPYMLAFSLGWLVRCCEEAGTRAAWLGLVSFFGAAVLVGAAIGGAWGDRLVWRFVVAAAIFLAFNAFRHRASLENRLGRLLFLLGEASFSIYLVHWFVLSTTGKLLGLTLPELDATVLVRVLGVGAAAYVGVLCFRYVELPLDRLLRSRRPAQTKEALSTRLRPALPP